MVRGPEVRAKQGARKRPIGGLLNANSRFRTSHADPAENAMNVVLGQAGPPGEFPWREFAGKKMATKIVHAIHANAKMTIVKGDSVYSLEISKSHIADMDDIWTQRSIFKKDLDDYLAREGKTQGQFCDECGISLSYLRGVLYAPGKKFGIEVLQKASSIFRLSVTRWIDDPGGAISGQDLSDQSEEARFFASLMVKDVASKDLTDEDRRYLYEDHLRAIERLRQLRARGIGTPGADSPVPKPEQDRGGSGGRPRRTPRPKR